jgi:2-C-methyl-D-erythritol 4-phosphate cytidylyltransferase
VSAERAVGGAGGAVAAVVLAGGSGTRFGAAVSKVYVELGDRPVLAHSLSTLDASQVVDHIVVVIRAEDRQAYGTAVDGCPTDKVRAVVDGGETRQGSEWAGITAVRDVAPDSGLVVLHDAARPFVTSALIADLVGTARTTGAGALPGRPVEGDLAGLDGAAAEVDDLVAVQTPQVFALSDLLEVYPKAIADGFDGVDTSATIRAYLPGAVRYVPSDDRNLKLTHPADLARAEALLHGWRSGSWAAG